MPTLVAAGQLSVLELLPELAAPPGPPSLRTVLARMQAALDSTSSRAESSSIMPADGSSTGDSIARKTILVADDLTALHCLSGSPAEWAAFLHACTSVGKAPGGAFVALAHSDVPDDEGWLARLEHSAEVVLDVEPLESGRSADLTGRLAVTVRGVAGDAGSAAAGAAAGEAAKSGPAPGTRRYCYKLGETGARYVEQVGTP